MNRKVARERGECSGRCEDPEVGGSLVHNRNSIIICCKNECMNSSVWVECGVNVREREETRLLREAGARSRRALWTYQTYKP